MTKKKFGDTTGLGYGSRIFVTYEGVTAEATFIAGTGQDHYRVVLDGTDQTISVPGETITKQPS